MRIDILKNCLEPQPITVVMYGARCNFKVIVKQVTFLIKRGLLLAQVNPTPNKWPKTLYLTTDKGREVLIRTDAIIGGI